MTPASPPALLRVGELARRVHMTVRALHHYDDIGLLRPRHRSAAGYRLYAQEDIARLQHIQALRSLGLGLAQIGRLLDEHPQDIAPLLRRHIQQLDQEIERQRQMRDGLYSLLDTTGTSSDWHGRLELIALCNRYLAPQDKQALPLLEADGRLRAPWRRRLRGLERLRLSGVPADHPHARRAARRWMIALEEETRRDPALFQQLRRMFKDEPALGRRTGLSPELDQYLLRAYAHHRLTLFQPYLSPEAFAYLSDHYPDALPLWPDLMADLLDAVQRGDAPAHPRTQALLDRWLALQQRYTLDAAAAKNLRLAQETEPGLQEGTWLPPAVLRLLKDALALRSLDV